MYYKIVIFTSIVLAGLSFNGCGTGSVENTQEVTQQNVIGKGLTKENYIELARYYYTKELVSTTVGKKRTFVRKDEKMRQLNHDSLVHHEKDTLYVKSVKSPNSYLHILELTYNDKLVQVQTNPSKKIVSVQYSDKSRAITKTKNYPFDSFLISDSETQEE